MNTRVRVWLALGVLALVFGLHAAAALRYPLGSDPSLFQYHAWAMTQGVMPYRDAFEFNTPGIVLLHGAFTQLLGFSDVAFIGVTLVLTAGALVGAGLWLRTRASLPSTLVGLTAGLLGFISVTPWDRGQRELFQGVFLALAFAAADRALRGERRALFAGLAGLAAGIAVSLKWPLVALVWPVWVLWLLAIGRARGPAGGRVGALSAVSLVGFLAPNVGWALWLWGNDALGAFAVAQRIVLPVHLSEFTVSWGELLLSRWPAGLAALTAVGLVAANRPSAHPQYRSAAALLALAVTGLGVLALYVLQRKGWTYHLHVALPLVAPLVALAFDRLVPERRAGLVALVLGAAALTQSGVLIAYDHSAAGLERAHRVAGHWDHDAMAKVAALIDTGAPSEVVQTNDDELQLLLMAKRRAATPFVYGFFASESHPDEMIKRLAMQRVDLVHKDPPDWVVWNTQPYQPALDSLEANPTLAIVLRTACREVLVDALPYRVWRCKGLGSEPSLDGPTALPAETVPVLPAETVPVPPAETVPVPPAETVPVPPAP